MARQAGYRDKTARLVGAWWMLALAVSALGVWLALQVSSTAGAGRESFFNVAHPWIVYVLMSALTGLLVYGLIRHATLWRLGQPTESGLFMEVRQRLMNVARLGVAQDKVRRDRYAGIMHWCISSSIVVLTLVTAQVALEDDTPLNFLNGRYYLFFSFYGDLFGLIGLVGVGTVSYTHLTLPTSDLV